jgi:ElaB/YqjD/DUF883 family membrane-anchored ribosome-binding protein
MDKNGASGAATVSYQVEEKIDALGNLVKGVIDQSAEKAEAIKSKVVEVKDQVVRRGRVAIARMAETIKAHPLAAVGIAFGAGYVVMRVLRR